MDYEIRKMSPEDWDEKSLSVHKKCGFREIGLRKRIGKMSNGTWRDVVLVEWRSESVGID